MQTTENNDLNVNKLFIDVLDGATVIYSMCGEGEKDCISNRLFNRFNAIFK